MKVFLVGYMGVGKTTIGKKLAYRLNIPFVDLDQRIEKSEGQSIPEIFSKKGEATFREIESAELQKLISSPESLVISTGGGAPCFHDNMCKMLDAGTVVWLTLPVGALVVRLGKSKDQRPLIQTFQTHEALSEFVVNHLAERERWYLRAHLSFETLNVTPERLDALTETIFYHSENRE